MFHGAIMEEVAAGQQSDRLQKAAMARLLKEAQLDSSKPGRRYLPGIRHFVNRLRLNGKRRMIPNKVGLLTQEC